MSSRGRYLIDARAMTGHSGVRGIGTYVRRLVEGLAGLGVGDRLELLTSRGGAGEAAAMGLAVRAELPVLKRRLQPVADPFLVSLALRRDPPALYHGVEWAQPLRAGGVPVAITVHDLIPFVFPGLYPWIRRERLLALHQLRRAGAVIVPSAATAADVERLAGVDPSALSVIPHGVDAGFHPAAAEDVERLRRRHRLEGPYLLSVGTLDERKRAGVLVSVAAAVRRDHDVVLAVAGDQGVYAPRLAAEIARHGLAGHVRLLGFVDEAELPALYSGAGCLLFPSAYEGFGLPLLEAMACGTPAVAFANSALPEVAGDAAILVPDGDVAAMAEAVAVLLDAPGPERAAREERGRRWAAAHTWERSARAHLAVYERLAAR